MVTLIKIMMLLNPDQHNWYGLFYSLDVASDSLSLFMVFEVASSFFLRALRIEAYHLCYFYRHRQKIDKNATVELADMADSDSIDSKEEQDADTSVDNVCYAKIKIPRKRGSGKDASVELTDLEGKGSAENKEEQDVATSVDNICYDKLPSKLYLVYPKSRLYV